MKKRILSLIMMLALMVFCFAGCGSTQKSDYHSAKNSTVVVMEYVVIDGEVAYNAYGSGFFVGKDGEDPQYLLTNHHVVEEYLDYGAGERNTVELKNGNEVSLKSYVRVYFDSTNYVEAYVVDYDKASDYALLRIEDPTSLRIPLTLRSPDEDMVGDAVYAVGFPGISDNSIIESTSSWGLDDISFTSGLLSRLVTTSGSGVRNIQTDATIQQGNSGGPLVDENGNAIGLNVMSVSSTEVSEESIYTEGVSYAVDISDVIPMLDQHKIEYDLYDESKSSIPIAAIGGCAAAVVLIILIIVLLTRKKSKPAKQTVSTPVTGETSYVNVDMNDSGLRVQGVSGALAGQRYKISAEVPLVFGRDSRVCNAVLPDNTPGVSGRHCSVSYMNGTVYLMDLGSSHGTFIKPGKKLAAGESVAIRPGDVFYLGSEAQSLTIVSNGGRY